MFLVLMLQIKVDIIFFIIAIRSMSYLLSDKGYNLHESEACHGVLICTGGVKMISYDAEIKKKKIYQVTLVSADSSSIYFKEEIIKAEFMLIKFTDN